MNNVLALLLATAASGQAHPGSRGELPRGLRAAVVESFFGLEPSDGADRWVAPNPAQDMLSELSPEGVVVTHEGRRLRMWLEAWGRDETGPIDRPELCASGRRIEYLRGPVTEWYVNGERGLEQGFTIAGPPEGEGDLRVVLGFEGGLAAVVLEGGRDARFEDGRGRAVFHYTDLRAWDASNTDLEASLEVRDGRLSIRVEDRGARYPVTIDPWIGTESQTLLPSGSNFQFANAVEIDGDVAVVGADRAHTYSGRAYVFERDVAGAGAWGEVAELSGSGRFGYSVAVHGDTIVVGSFGSEAAFVFERDWPSPGSWGEFARLIPSDGNTGDLFGREVALQGETALARNSAGDLYVYERSQGPGNWGQVLKIPSPEVGPVYDLAFSVDTVALASWHTAYMYGRDQGGPGAWGPIAQIAHQATFTGWDVALDGDVLVIGAGAESVGGMTNAGASYVFERDQGGPNAWGQVAHLTASDAEKGDRFGTAVAVSGDTVVVGAPYEDTNGKYAGAGYVFERNQGGPGTWGQVAKVLATALTNNNFFLGDSVAVSGGTALLGPNVTYGSVYVFDAPWGTTPGPPVSYCTAGFSASGCQALLSASGTASASASSGFVLDASGVEGGKSGLFFYGTNGRQAAPWGAGTSFVCVVPPRLRGGLLNGSGTVGECDGALSQDLNARWCSTCPKPAHNPGAGALVQAQLWYRDPQTTSNASSSMSDAIEFCVGP